MTNTKSNYKKTSTFLVLIVTLCTMIATILVVFSDIPPVFNRGIGQYRIINIIITVFLALISSILVMNLLRNYFEKLVVIIKIIFVWVLTIEVLLGIFDVTIISVNGSPLKSGFYNLKSNNDNLILTQPNELSPFGFRVSHADDSDYDGFRILFLGNSYVRGSSRNIANNYPQVVEDRLRKLLPNKNISIMSAGVDGYGLMEDNVLYNFLHDKGYKTDAIVLHIMMQSDLTNNVPGTIRRAVAGAQQRFHENKFMRHFYPMNSYISRYGIYFSIVFGTTWESNDVRKSQDASCPISSTFSSFIKERAINYYGPNAKNSVYLDYNMKGARDIIKTANDRNIPIFVVLFPDPTYALDVYRDMFHNTVMNWDWTREAVTSSLAPIAPVFDLTSSFRNKVDMFRCDDSHWTETGNIYGGELVSEWLANNLH